MKDQSINSFQRFYHIRYLTKDFTSWDALIRERGKIRSWHDEGTSPIVFVRRSLSCWLTVDAFRDTDERSFNIQIIFSFVYERSEVWKRQRVRDTNKGSWTFPVFEVSSFFSGFQSSMKSFKDESWNLTGFLLTDCPLHIDWRISIKRKRLLVSSVISVWISQFEIKIYQKTIKLW